MIHRGEAWQKLYQPFTWILGGHPSLGLSLVAAAPSWTGGPGTDDGDWDSMSADEQQTGRLELNRREKNGEETVLVPSPGIGTEHMEAPFRRLIEFDFTCPLCGDPHLASFYYTEEAIGLEEFLRALHSFAQDWTKVQRVLGESAMEIHEREGDIGELVEQIQRDGLKETPVPGYRIIDERLYTCNGCGAEFQTMRELREHDADGC